MSFLINNMTSFVKKSRQEVYLEIDAIHNISLKIKDFAVNNKEDDGSSSAFLKKMKDYKHSLGIGDMIDTISDLDKMLKDTDFEQSRNVTNQKKDSRNEKFILRDFILELNGTFPPYYFI